MPLPELTWTATRECRRELLAADSHARVERCDCGCMHLTLGPLTMRTTVEAARSFLLVLDTALRHLAYHEREDAAALPWTLRAPGGDAS